MKTHGMWKSSEYETWRSMKQRCFNPNRETYKDYGGRGITVCERWKNSFQAFYQDMGEKPFPEASIERRDNNEGYTPENCYWADRTVQSINQRISVKNKSGIKGISLYKRTGKWRAIITYKNEIIHLGYFATSEEAVEARDLYIIENELSSFKLQSIRYREMYPE